MAAQVYFDDAMLTREARAAILDAGGRVVAFSGRILPVAAGMEGLDEDLVPEDAGKYVNSPETPLYKKGELLYGLTAARMSIRQRERALLVEGNFDVVQMHQHGFTETVAPLGTSFTDAQAKLLRRHTDRVTFLFDGDGAGRRAARAAHAVAERGGYVARVGVLPPDADPDEEPADPKALAAMREAAAMSTRKGRSETD